MKTDQEKLISKKLSAKKWRDKNKLKILEKNRIKDKKDIERISREIKILKKVRHPNII